MSAQEDVYTDDYVATLLKQDAETSSRNYSSVGLTSLLPKRPLGAAPKPNTRFLRNIIRETDSHNAALLAKEKRDAKERQRRLIQSESANTHGSSRKGRDHHRSRGERDKDHSIEHRRKRRKSSIELDGSDGEDGRRRARRSRRQSESNSRSRSRSPHRDRSRREKHDKRHERRKRRTSRSPDHQSRHDKGTSGHRRSRHRESTSRRDRHVSDKTPGSPSRSPFRHTANHRLKDTDFTSKSRQDHHEDSRTAEDSDPLDDLIGPAPPPKVHTKGRGAVQASSHSTIDSHFAATYDPSVDVQPDPETQDDWDQALEAMRDRQRWKQQGAARLKSAGFSDADVKKWEKGDAKDETDVTWATKAQVREWDRGKVVDADGTVDLKPSWA